MKKLSTLLALLYCLLAPLFSGCKNEPAPADVSYSLILFVSTDGNVQVRITPDAVLESIELSSADSGVVWQAEAPAMGNTLEPSEYIELGTAPEGWSISTGSFEGFVNGTQYTVTATLDTGDEVSATWTYSATQVGAQWMSRSQLGLENQMAHWPFTQPSITHFNERIFVLYGCQTREAPQNQGICTFDDLAGTSSDPSAGSLLATILQPTPNLSGGQVYGQAPVVAPGGWTYNSATAVSEALKRADGVDGIAIAQLMYNPAAPSGAPVLTVLESGAPQIRYRYSYNPLSVYQTTWGSEWTMIGGASFGTFPAGSYTYRNYKPSLVHGTVSGLASQNSAKPYVVSAIGAATTLGVYYFNQSNTWASIPVAGISMPSETLQAFEMARTDSGDLYGCVTVQVASPIPHYEARILKYDGASSWSTIASNTTVMQNTSYSQLGCRIAAQGNQVVAALIQQDGTPWIRKVQGSTATEIAWPAANPVARIWDLAVGTDGTVHLALTSQHVPDATGANVNPGPKHGLYRSNGGAWTTVVSTYGNPHDGMGQATYSIQGMQIRPDRQGLSAFGYTYFFDDGMINNGAYWPSTWSLIAP